MKSYVSILLDSVFAHLLKWLERWLSKEFANTLATLVVAIIPQFIIGSLGLILALAGYQSYIAEDMFWFVPFSGGVYLLLLTAHTITIMISMLMGWSHVTVWLAKWHPVLENKNEDELI